LANYSLNIFLEVFVFQRGFSPSSGASGGAQPWSQISAWRASSRWAVPLFLRELSRLYGFVYILLCYS